MCEYLMKVVNILFYNNNGSNAGMCENESNVMVW